MGRSYKNIVPQGAVQEELFELYRDKGVIANDLEERDDALVNPPALQPTGGRSSPTWMDVDSGDDGGADLAQRHGHPVRPADDRAPRRRDRHGRRGTR